MAIRLAQVRDALAAFEVTCTAASDADMGYRTMELFSGQPVEEGVLYIQDRERGVNDGSDTVFFAQSGAGSTEDLLIATNIDAVRALNAALRFVMRFESRLEEIRSAYFSDHSLMRLCQAVSDYVDNPVNAFDGDGLPLAQVGYERDQAIEYFGAETISPEYLLNELQNWKVVNADDYLMQTSPYRFVSQSSGIRTVMCNIMSDGLRVGMLEIFETRKRATDSEMLFLQRVCEILSGPLPFDRNKVIINTLKGEELQEGLAQNLSLSLHWREGDGIYVIAIRYPQRYDDYEVAKLSAMRVVKSQVANAVHVIIDDDLVIVANNRLDARDATLRHLSDYLAHSGAAVRIGSSETMPSIDVLHVGYEHARFAARLAFEQNQDRVVRFEECRFAYFADACGLDAKQHLIVDKRVSRMHADDERAGSQNTQTALAYIEAGFNLNATADTLAVHRNTVVYRLKLIRDRYGIDLTEPLSENDLVFQVLLSCKLLLGSA